jgi:hypothetical protein
MDLCLGGLQRVDGAIGVHLARCAGVEELPGAIGFLFRVDTSISRCAHRLERDCGFLRPGVDFISSAPARDAVSGLDGMRMRNPLLTG